MRVAQFLIGLLLLAGGVLLILNVRKIYARMDREITGRFWRWYWGISDSGFGFSFHLKLLLFGLLIFVAGAANIYWSLFE